MIIVGAGLSGLIAGAMIRQPGVSIFEKQSELPNNHSALLRFKSSVVGDAVGIPFRKVKVMKAVAGYINPVADAMSYSFKVTGSYTLRSSTTANGEIEERYIAPPDLVQRLGAINQSRFAFDLGMHDAFNVNLREPIISTIPMPALMDILGWERKSEFRSLSGFTVTADLPKDLFDVCATLYIPDPSIRTYRASITDSKLIVEYIGEPREGELNNNDLRYALKNLGIHVNYWEGIRQTATIKASQYAKILPIDEDERRRFIIWASAEHNIYSLGRYATWRPGMLLDDLVNDVRVIQRLIAKPGETYAHKLKG